MKVEINGDLKRTEKRFVCRICGCTFIANATEYCVEHEYRGNGEIREISAKCPCCGVRVIYNPEEAEKDSIIPKDQKKA